MFVERLDQLLVEMEQEQNRLAKTERKDEAVFIGVGINIVNVGKTVWMAFATVQPEEKRRDAFMRKMEGLQAAWEESRARSEKYNDKDKVMIEDIKLNTLEKVVSIFRECTK